MLCAKCHQNEATFHFTPVVNGEAREMVHLCKRCAPPTGLHSLDAKQLQEQFVAGKKCGFCGQSAFSGVSYPGGPIYWCFDCGEEFGRIIIDLCLSERPDLMQRSKKGSWSVHMGVDPKLRAWEEALHRKAVQLLKERRGENGRDKGS